MTRIKGTTPAPRRSSEAKKVDGGCGNLGSAPCERVAREPSGQSATVTAIKAELAGSRTCSALGVSVTASAPVLELCYLLVQAGIDPDTPLEAYRGEMLCLTVRSIGEGARITVEDSRHGTPHFRPRRTRGVGTSLPIDPNRTPGGLAHSDIDSDHDVSDDT
jgi:hypothetical protein